jgi:hypothetical protein
VLALSCHNKARYPSTRRAIPRQGALSLAASSSRFGDSNEKLLVVCDRHCERPNDSVRARLQLGAFLRRVTPMSVMNTRVLGVAAARGNGSRYGIGAGAAAVATGALIGGAIAAQNQALTTPRTAATTPRTMATTLLQPDPGLFRIFQAKLCI